DFSGVAVLTGVFVLPLAGLEAPFDIHRTPLAQVFARDFSQTVIEDNAVPFRFLAALARVFVFPLRCSGYGDIADGGAVWAVAHFGVAAEIANEYDFI